LSFQKVKKSPHPNPLPEREIVFVLLASKDLKNLLRFIYGKADKCEITKFIEYHM